MDFTTTLLELSSRLQDKLSLLSNFNLLSALQELSAIPIHPYDRLKYDLFGKDYEFKTIKDLETPNDFCPHSYFCELTSISEKTNQITLCALSSVSQTAPSLFETNTIVDQEHLKKNLEFVEVVKTITIEDIQTQPYELMQKLTSFYIKNLK